MRLLRVGNYLSVNAIAASDCHSYGDHVLELVVNPVELWNDIRCLLRIPIYNGLALKYMQHHYPGIRSWETLGRYWKRVGRD